MISKTVKQKIKKVNSYQGGGKEGTESDSKYIPTREEYIQQKLDSVNTDALAKSRAKTPEQTTKVTPQMVYGLPYDPEELEPYQSWLEQYKNELNMLELQEANRLDVSRRDTPEFMAPNIRREKDLEAIRQDIILLENQIEKLKRGEVDPQDSYTLTNCIANLAEFFPHGLPYGNQTFAKNPKKYGFSRINAQEIRPGDLVQTLYYDKTPIHAMMYNGLDSNGKPTYNYSNGHMPVYNNGKYVSGGYGVGKFYPLTDEYSVYRFTGTPQDSAMWTNEYLQKYGTSEQYKKGGKFTHKHDQETSESTSNSSNGYLNLTIPTLSNDATRIEEPVYVEPITPAEGYLSPSEVRLWSDVPEEQKRQIEREALQKGFLSEGKSRSVLNYGLLGRFADKVNPNGQRNLGQIAAENIVNGTNAVLHNDVFNTIIPYEFLKESVTGQNEAGLLGIIGGAFNKPLMRLKRIFAPNTIKEAEQATQIVAPKAASQTLTRPATQNVVPEFSIMNLPGFQLKGFMRGNALEKQLSKAGTVSVNVIKAHANKQDKLTQEIVNQVLSEDFKDQDKIDYNELRQAIQKRLVQYQATPDERYATYGMDRIGYPTPIPFGRYYNAVRDYKQGTEVLKKVERGEFVPEAVLRSTKHKIPLWEEIISQFENYPVYFSTFRFTNPSEFPFGNGKHYGSYTLGHSRTFTDKEHPDVLYVMESQSDWAQSPMSYTDLEIAVKEGDISEKNAKNKYLMHIPHLQKTYQQRQLIENLKFAAESNRTKMRYPTAETAAKIEGYQPETKWFTPEGKEIDQITSLQFNPTTGDFEAPVGTVVKQVYSPEHQTILKKYSDFPKLFQKLYKGQNVRTVTDSKGNTWYEVDVPKDFLNQEWQYGLGGYLHYTRSPLQPFQFSKNNYLKTPTVRYQGGGILDTQNDDGTKSQFGKLKSVAKSVLRILGLYNNDNSNNNSSNVDESPQQTVPVSYNGNIYNIDKEAFNSLQDTILLNPHVNDMNRKIEGAYDYTNKFIKNLSKIEWIDRENNLKMSSDVAPVNLVSVDKENNILTELDKNKYISSVRPKYDYLSESGLNNTINSLKKLGVYDKINEISNQYGVDPNLVVRRFTKEGIFDEILKTYNEYSSPNKQKELLNTSFDELLNKYYDSFHYGGLDTFLGLYKEGKINIKNKEFDDYLKNVLENKHYGIGVNEGKTMTLNFNVTPLQALEAYAAYFSYLKNKYPNDNSAMLNARYNLGEYHKKLKDTNWINSEYSVPSYYSVQTK